MPNLNEDDNWVTEDPLESADIVSEVVGERIADEAGHAFFCEIANFRSAQDVKPTILTIGKSVSEYMRNYRCGDRYEWDIIVASLSCREVAEFFGIHQELETIKAKVKMRLQQIDPYTSPPRVLQRIANKHINGMDE